MPAQEFLQRVARRMDRIDRKSLEGYVLELANEAQFLKHLLDQIPEGIVVLTFNQEVIFVNRRGIQLFNVQEPLAGKETLEKLIPDAPLVALVSDALKEKRELFQKEFEILLPRPMSLRLNLFYERKQKPPVAILTVASMTQSEMNMRERFKLENWETMLGLAAGIAHEIGNPLNSLTIHLKLLAKILQKLPAQERKNIHNSIKIMEDETARLDRIVRNFLGATRRKPVRFELTQLNDLLLKTISFLKPELKKAKIRVLEELDKHMPVFLLDPERIQQVFLNIIKNAIHAMPHGGTLKIQTEAGEKLCAIHFMDTGVGIASDKISRIFDAYYTTKEEGSGLGLMIVYQIIREHGGRIEVSSKPKGGTTFSIILPIRKEKLGLPQPVMEQTS
ncbi:MAG: PAS domain-containing protein [Candidatus Omnitrophica bacterium]|nr:PAS domain-containing protein [Candidatus Omnitrophota bacterium]